MAITSFQFALFTIGVLVVYYLLPRRLQNFWLLLISYIFYITWDLYFALTLFLLTIANFVIAMQLRAGDQGRRGLLWIGIGLNIFALVFFRVENFFLPGLVSLLSQFGVQVQVGGLQFLLPVGLSFRVLENISYLVDVYRKQTTPSTDFIDFSLYLVYFPKMVAGPIERARSFLPKLVQERVVDNEVLARSFVLIVVGIVRKVVIADALAISITYNVFQRPSEFPAPELLGWLFVYAFAVYNDFAGYTSIVRGVSGLFGIELSPNFNFPYFARSFNEFWNRWHITLSHWLRDYVFYPLNRILLRSIPNRQNWINLTIPPLATMLVSGLWHGMSWNMLIWGGLHGLYLIFERLFLLWRPVIPAEQQPRWRQAISMGVVFLLVSLAWVPFRLELPVALEYWRGLFALPTYAVAIQSPRLFLRLFYVLLFLVPVIGLDWLQQRYQDEAFILRWPRMAQATLLAVAMLLIFIATQTEGGPPFVYQGF